MPPRLLTIEGDYSLHVIQERKLAFELMSRSVGGWFERVWHVNPLVGADLNEPADSSFGPPTVNVLAPGHIVVEGHIGLSRRLQRLAILNLVLAQISLFIALSRIIRREGVSIVRAGDPYYLGMVGYVLAKLHRKPFVLKIAGNYDAAFQATGKPAYPRLLRSRRVEKRIERWLLERADLVAAANGNNLTFALANGARPSRSTIFRVGSWVDPDHFEADPPKIDLLASLGIQNVPVAVLVSRLEPLKYPEDVLRAFAEASKEFPELQLLVVGDGSLRANLEKVASELEVVDRIHFIGARDQIEVRAALHEATVILAPLAGRALVEAALSGRPIVAYDFEWHSELLDRRSGILVPYRDYVAMGEAMVRLLRDPALADQMARRARQKCLEMMDPKKLADHERAVYESILAT